jgi:hypothetical protein
MADGIELAFEGLTNKTFIDKKKKLPKKLNTEFSCFQRLDNVLSTFLHQLLYMFF